jgi:Zn-dependent peptidase ImmA (M78 family)/transcriptional regulator with XRE-family HTH domain
MVTRVPAECGVLQWARDACGLTVEAAAKLLGCKPDLLRDIELGKKHPSVSMFRSMASIYGFPEATLLAATPPMLPEFPQDHRTFDGIPPRLTYPTIIAIRGVQMRQESLRELAEIDGSIEAPSPRRYRRIDNPEDVAAAERKCFGVSIGNQLKLSADKLWMTYRVRIEAQGISVYIEDIPAKDCRGVSLFVDGFPAIIISSEELRPAWKLFSLLHEYAHVLIREPGISDQKRATRDPVEAFCNRFAAAFLMPEEAIGAVLAVSRDTPREFSIETLDEAAHALAVSISALALRLEDLEYAPSGYFNRIRAMIKTPPPRKPHSGPIPRQYVVLNHLGHRFSGDVLRSVRSGALTTLEASRMLGTNPTLLPTIVDTIDGRHRDYLYGGVQT